MPVPITRFAVERKVTTGMVLLGVVALGFVALDRLPLELFPTFSSSNITVRAAYPASSPAEVERRLVRPLEDSLSTINGLETLTASAAADGATLRLTFVDGTEMDLAAVEVRDRIERVRHRLPDDLERIWVRRFQSSDIPVLRFDLSAPWPPERLYDFAERVVQPRLERLPGVAQVDVSGLRTPEIRVDVSRDRLSAHGLDLPTLANRLRAENVTLTVGELLEGQRELVVRAVGELGSAAEVRALPLDGAGLTLGDVADVQATLSRAESFSFLDGRPSLSVGVNKVSTANLLEVAAVVKSELEAIVTRPGAEELVANVYRDTSIDVADGLGQLEATGLLGGVLAILAVYLFIRRVRTTLLVAVAIPVSVVATFVIIYLLRAAGLSDLTLNVVSLAGLMLALGMLVDNSVVVIESIYRHRGELGHDARTAAIEGTEEVALPVVASTATTLCVFLPLVFLGQGGRMAIYLQNIAATVSIVIVASLLVALTVVPMVASVLLEREEARPSRLIDRLTSGYGRLLGFTLHHRGWFLLSIVVMLAGSIALWQTIERSFSSGAEEREILLHVDTSRQFTLPQIEGLYTELYDLLDRHRGELDIAHVAYSYDRAAGPSPSSWGRNRRFEIYLVDAAEARLTTAEARSRLRELLPQRAGVDLRIGLGRGPRGHSGVEVELRGDDVNVLRLVSSRIADRLASLPMLEDVDVSLESGDEEIRVDIDRERAAQVGISSRGVAGSVLRALSDRGVTHVQTAERELPIVVRFGPGEIEDLGRIPVPTRVGAMELDTLARLEVAPGPQTIEREDHAAKVTVSANTEDQSGSFAAMGAVRELMTGLSLPPGYSWSFGRWNRYQERDLATGSFSLLFAAILVYFVMAALFESFLQPLTIMLSVPFALLGVGLFMRLASQPWDTMTTVGLVVLLGVVVNNAIVLVDHVNLLRRRGLPRREAIIRGGQHRLRPILITAVTTLLGLLPMVAPLLLPSWFGPLEGRAGTWAPIGLVIFGGLTTSTFLTLVIIPTFYSLLDDLASAARRVVAEVLTPTSPTLPGPEGPAQ